MQVGQELSRGGSFCLFLKDGNDESAKEGAFKSEIKKSVFH